jgi:hypothetical protein
MEAAVDVTKRIAVVPEIRLTTFSRPYDGPTVFLIRPGVSAALSCRFGENAAHRETKVFISALLRAEFR